MIHTGENLRRRGGRLTGASGTTKDGESGGASIVSPLVRVTGKSLLLFRGVPNQTRVERVRRQHRQNDHTSESESSLARINRHHRAQLDDADQNGYDEDVHH